MEENLDFDIHIEKLGSLNSENIFGFYKYLVNKYDLKNHALLESASENTKETLYSFIALEPDFMLEINENQFKIYDITTARGESIKDYIDSKDPAEERPHNPLPFKDNVDYNMVALDVLSHLTPYSNLPFTELFPRNIFYGGMLGYIGYDVVAPYVGYKSTSEFPDILMGLYTKVLVYSHKSNALFMIDNSIDDYTKDKDIRYQLSLFTRNNKSYEMKEILFDIEEVDESNFRSNTSKSAHERMVEKTKEYIYAGDIIQAVISRRLYRESKIDPMKIYEVLRELNPSQYMYNINFDNVKIIGSSPEALISKNKDLLHTVPIAGTIRRGITPEEDLKLEQELLNDPKELSEHLQLVDLARNDLAKVSYPGSVNTYEFMSIQKYQKVQHIVSKVRSRTPLDGYQVLKSMFPAGTLSGAPKLRAMQIIQELETESRGPYGGAVGYFSFNGDLTFAIAIRTLFGMNSKYFAQAGGGIVADSCPEDEFKETYNKLYSVIKSIKIAEARV
ncbi:MAG: anthranilate synthase component I family protein [Promethearchaeota archaeon]|nr:MAG: anthranilate synthase component I family protein [Candidatus Lokiarchaeota archaeon]